MKTKSYLSPSTAKMLLDYPTPIAYHKIHNRTPATPPMIFGSLVDALITEPDKIEKEFLILEGKMADGRTTEGKKAKAQALADNLTPVKAETFNEAKRAAIRIETHPHFQKLKAPQFQVKLEAEIDGVPCLGYADIVADDVIIDLKVFNLQAFENPSRTIYQRRIMLQLWMYQQMLQTSKRLGVMVCLSEEPYHVEMWWLDEDWEKIAKRQFEEACEWYEEYKIYDPDHSTSGGSRFVYTESWMR